LNINLNNCPIMAEQKTPKPEAATKEAPKPENKQLSQEAQTMLKDQAREVGQNGFMIYPRDNLD
jgi:hypothetical protein